MKKLTLAGFVLAVLLSLVAAPAVLADEVYHSEHLPFVLTAAGAAAGHPGLRSGQVINIHPNGPVVGAIENYMVNGAKSNTTYDVVLTARSGGCAGAVMLTLTTTQLSTDAQGNGHSKFVFPTSALAPLSGSTLGVQWALVAGGVAAYQTTCTVVVID